MPLFNSPLRYPGGKGILSDFLGSVLEINGLQDGTYVEPYAGGAGAALNLLFAEHIQHIVLNDADPCVFAFWEAILKRKKAFIKLLQETPVTITEWKRQREIYLNYTRHSRLRVGFASFYLNRCNRSGIIANGGPVGGIKQKGKWKIDARYNKKELLRRIEKIALYRDRISLYNMDAIDFLKQIVRKSDLINQTLVYLDPPYYEKGSQLYLNYYQDDDHAKLAHFIKKQTSFRWILSYDDAPRIHELYSDRKVINFKLRYCANTRKAGSELLIASEGLILPEGIAPVSLAS